MDVFFLLVPDVTQPRSYAALKAQYNGFNDERMGTKIN